MNQNNISLKKVIKGLEYHSEGNCFKSDDDETGCPYWKDSFCSQHLCSDALALLKAQEPVDVIPVITKDGKMLMAGNCPECGMRLDHFFNGNYCGCCGRRVKWE